MNVLLNNVHVINLERSQERLRNIDNNLKKFNIKYERFDAIDGRKLSLDDIDRDTTFMCRYFLCNRSIIGCAMSHIALWDIISKSNSKWHLILEDDIEFSNETIDFINELSKTTIIDEDNIIINLSCIGIGCYGSEIIFSSLDKKEKVSLLKPYYPLGTAAYLITKNTAKKLYDYFEEYKINYHIDSQIGRNFDKFGINYLITNKKIVNSTDEKFGSTIGSKSLPLLSNLLMILGFNHLSWSLSVPVVTINLSITIDKYIIFFIILLLLNLFLIRSPYVYIYLILELIIAIILRTIYN